MELGRDKHKKDEFERWKWKVEENCRRLAAAEDFSPGQKLTQHARAKVEQDYITDMLFYYITHV